MARETRARAEARAFAVQVLVVLLVNELRLECPFKALERIVPVLGTILTNGLRALVLGDPSWIRGRDGKNCVLASSPPYFCECGGLRFVLQQDSQH